MLQGLHSPVPSSSAVPPVDLSTVSVVIPALDEERSLPLVLRDLPAVGRVVVVDNGSTDRTAAVAEEGGADVITEPRRGYGSACAAGIDHVASVLGDSLHNDHVLVILDADHADDPSLLPDLVSPILQDEADMVLSDRTTTAERGALLPHQRYGNALAVHLMAAVVGHRYHDMGPFRAIRLSALLDMQLRDRNYGWNVEMQMKAIQRGLRVQEVPMPYRPRVGVSKISGTVRGTLRAGTKILLSVWRYR